MSYTAEARVERWQDQGQNRKKPLLFDILYGLIVNVHPRAISWYRLTWSENYADYGEVLSMKGERSVEVVAMVIAESCRHKSQHYGHLVRAR